MTAVLARQKVADNRSAFFKRILPNNNLVAGLWLPRADARRATRNLKHPMPESRSFASLAGAPTYSPGFASFVSSQNYIQTDITETANITYVIASKTSADGAANSTRPNFIGNFNGSTGSMIYLSTNTPHMRGQGYDGSGTNITRVLAATGIANTWKLWALTLSTTEIKLWNLTDGTSSAIAMTGRTIDTTRGIRIGSSHSSAFNGGVCDIAAAVICTAALDATQLAALRTALQAELAGFSISI